MGSPATGFPHDVNIIESFARSCCFDQDARGVYLCVVVFLLFFVVGDRERERERERDGVGLGGGGYSSEQVGTG